MYFAIQFRDIKNLDRQILVPAIHLTYLTVESSSPLRRLHHSRTSFVAGQSTKSSLSSFRDYQFTLIVWWWNCRYWYLFYWCFGYLLSRLLLSHVGRHLRHLHCFRASHLQVATVKWSTVSARWTDYTDRPCRSLMMNSWKDIYGQSSERSFTNHKEKE